MKRIKLLTCSVLAVLAAMLLTGCQWNDNPVRTSLEVEQTDLTLQVGESATRAASTQSKDYEFIYTSSNPAVATVDQNGKVTALTVGEATITVTMPETKVGWYAAATREYKVFVKKVSAAALADVDKSTPLTLVAAENGKITVTFNNGVTLKNDIHYTINGGAEQTIAKNTSGAYDITVKKGDVVQLYSLNSSLGGSAVAGARGGTRAVDSGAKYINIRPSMKTEIYGNVMSLLKGKDNLESATTIEANNAFYGLFAGAEKLVNNTERLLVLPATTLTEGCYDNMFSGCKGIEKAPELPAPKLEKGCYQEMFYDCSKLNSVKCLASDVAASDALKDFLKGAGTAAEKTPVIEIATALPEGTIPSNFTEAKAVTGIKLSETTLEMTVSDTKPLTATLTPAEATNKTLEWTSSNPAVATVLGDATDNTKATVTAVGAGSATITCSTPDGSIKTTCAVSVAAPQQEEGSNIASLLASAQTVKFYLSYNSGSGWEDGVATFTRNIEGGYYDFSSGEGTTMFPGSLSENYYAYLGVFSDDGDYEFFYRLEEWAGTWKNIRITFYADGTYAFTKQPHAGNVRFDKIVIDGTEYSPANLSNPYTSEITVTRTSDSYILYYKPGETWSNLAFRYDIIPQNAPAPSTDIIGYYMGIAGTDYNLMNGANRVLPTDNVSSTATYTFVVPAE